MDKINLIYDYIDPVKGIQSNLKEVFGDRAYFDNSDIKDALPEESQNIVPSYFCDSLSGGWFYPITVNRPLFHIDDILCTQHYRNEKEAYSHFFHRLPAKVKEGLANNQGWVLLNINENISKAYYNQLLKQIENKSYIPFNRFIFCNAVPHTNHPNFIANLNFSSYEMVKFNLEEPCKMFDRKVYACFNKNSDQWFRRSQFQQAIKSADLEKYGYISTPEQKKVDINTINYVDINVIIEAFTTKIEEGFMDNPETLPILSEKVFRSAAYRKPFLMFAYPHALKDLKWMGYKSFDKIFDESYDNEENDLKRIKMIVFELYKFCLKTDEERKELIDSISDVLEHNFQLYKKLSDKNTFYNRLLKIQKENML